MRARRLVLLAGLAAAVTAPVAAADPAATPGVLIIDTIAGIGERGDKGDGGPATKAELKWPHGIAIDPAGNVYLQQQGEWGYTGDTVRKIDTKGVITTLVGAGDEPPTKDGIPVAESDISGAEALAADKAGNIYITSEDPKDEKDRLYQVYDGGKKIRTFAGGGSTEPANGTLATDARIGSLRDVWVGADGDIYVTSNYRVLKIDHSTSRITVIAGTGEWKKYDPADEGKPATEAGLADAGSLAVDKAGNVYLNDFGSGRLRQVSTMDGKIRTVACGGSEPAKDGVPALNAECRVGHVGVDAAGTVYFTTIDSTTGYNEGWVLTIDKDKKIKPVIGTRKIGFGGDGGKASEARLNDPRALRWDTAGNLYISDSQNYRIRKVTKVVLVAKDDSLTVEPGKEGKGDVLANDTGTKLKVSAHTDPKSGSVTIGPDGKFSYKPKDGFTGDDSFGYTVTDPYGQQATAKVTIAVKTGGTAPAPQGSSGGLAATGASVVSLTAAAVGLLGLGGGLVAFTARRRRRRSA